MPIQEQNIVFVESQVMDDVPEGGGAATGNVIADGQMNNVFEDISDLDRAYGRFNLRKVAVAVRTLDTDLFGGAKTVITQLPEDPAISYALFATPDPFDTRVEAADRVEAYLYKGPTWPGHLQENHIVGMRAINVIQRIGTELPPVGKTLTLVQDEGLGTEKEQYVRVIKVTVTETNFTDTVGDFPRWIVTLDLSDALRYDFAGHTPQRYDANYNYTGKVRIRDTTVADATSYHGAQSLTTSSAIGDTTVRVASIFTALVPSAQTETALVNQILAPELTVTLSAGTRDVDIPQQAHTLSRDVTAESRRYNWIETLAPIPAPGLLTVAYRAQGNWYVLQDNGAGTISGSDPALGAGTIDYVTGATNVTLGALPDAGSQIIWTWASLVHYTVRAGLTSDAGSTLRLAYTLANAPIIPGTHVATYPVDGIDRTTSETGGIISGTGVSGTLNAATGDVILEFTQPPDRASQISNAYTWRDGDVIGSTESATVTDGEIDLSALAPFRGTGAMFFNLADGSSVQGYLGTGGTVFAVQGGGMFNRLYQSAQVGVFNATTGIISITTQVPYVRNVWTGTAWAPGESGSTAIVSAWNIRIERDTETFDPQAVTAEQVSPSTIGLTLDLTDTTADAVVANSVRMSVTGQSYDDRDGTIYTNIDPETGAGLPAGTMNYATGVATLTYWGDAVGANVTVNACLAVYGQWTATAAALRTTLSPIKSEALSLTATIMNGDSISGAADPDGVIVGTWMRGEINYKYGTAWVEFGQLDGETWVPREVDPSTIRYNAVAYNYLPLDADILGIDPVRLPPDGRVPIFRPGDIVMVMHTDDTAPATIADGGTIVCGRTRIGWVRLIDANGDTIPTGYELDRATGIVTVPDVTGLAQPLTVRHTVGDLRMLTDVQITGDLSFARPLTHAFPSGEAIVASCIIHGDRRARVSAVWDQQSWDGSTWSDSIIGNEATATLDTIAHPIQVTNEGAETERWVLRWTSTSNVELIGQRRGLVYSGAFTADIAPINPRTREPDGTGGVPYMLIPVAANGGGWSTGNVVRINTVGAIAPLWIARAIQQSDEPLDDGADGCDLYCLGNIDRP